MIKPRSEIDVEAMWDAFPEGWHRMDLQKVIVFSIMTEPLPNPKQLWERRSVIIEQTKPAVMLQSQWGEMGKDGTPDMETAKEEAIDIHDPFWIDVLRLCLQFTFE